MMRGASGDECEKLLGQEYNRPAEADVLKKPREATLTLTFYPLQGNFRRHYYTILRESSKSQNLPIRQFTQLFT
jgi:hypothetical protein